jgi:3-isopropylmalate/(R)-2-methylmalate dehydratase small subunit
MTTEKTAGKVWVFGDDIDTDALAPGLYMKGPLEELASHCLKAIDPNFAATVQHGDVVVAGVNFGIGSSREQAVEALKYLGVRTLVAKSFGGIFFRNALNFGMVAVVSADVDRISPGDRITVDAASGTIENLSKNETYTCEILPPQLLAMVRDGGLVEHLEKKRAQAQLKDAGQ